MQPDNTPDGTYRVYSPALIAKLISAGCLPVARHRDGNMTFHKTSTVRQIIADHAEEARRARQ